MDPLARPGHGRPETPEPTDLWRRRVSPRQFLKLLGVGAAATAGGLAAGGRRVEAEYDEDPGWLGYDQVDRELRVNGNLLVQAGGTVTIGSYSGNPGALKVGGNICVGGVEAVDASGVVKKSYYAP